MDYRERDHMVDREITPLVLKFDEDSDEDFLDGDSISDDEEDDKSSIYNIRSSSS